MRISIGLSRLSWPRPDSTKPFLQRAKNSIQSHCPAQTPPVRYPVIVGVGLSPEERRTTEFFLAPADNVRVPSLLRPAELSRGCNVLLNGTDQDIAAILEWRLPLLVICGAAVSVEKRDHYFRQGAAALWIPREQARGVFLLPPLELPEIRGSIFVVSDDDPHRRLLRQLFRFRGYDLRTDFRSAEEMVEMLRALHDAGTPGSSFPELLVLDLDSRRVDVPAFFHRLRVLRSEQPGLVRRTRVIVTKDFQRPGADVRTLAANVRAFARRIYHPLEAAFVFLEGFVYRDEQGPLHYRSSAYRPAAEIIFGETGRFPVHSPRGSVDILAGELARLTRALPFLELHRFLDRTAREGALLAPQPDVDAGDLLHGVRSPKTPGVRLKNASE